jgi:hypothetical protein
MAAGVPCEVEVVPKAAVSQDFSASQIDWLRQVFTQTQSADA